MKSDDITATHIHEIKTISPSSSPRDLAINTASEDRASSSIDSSDSSPSDLRRRLEDLPSPNEFTVLADRVAVLGRRICRKRESFLRLHEVANRIEENDEWEEREQRAGFESSSRARDARARRRARVRLESSPCSADKAMMISQAGDPSTITSDDGKLNPAESCVDRSARNDRLRLPAIPMSRKQSLENNRSSSLSEPSSTCFPHRRSNGESRDIKCTTASHSHRNFTSRDSGSKSDDLPSVSPFSLSSVRPKKFGGYRPPSGIVLKNLSSSSESESATEASRGLSSARKIGNTTITTLELSSPESTAVSTVNGPIKKMPIMSARNDIIGSILPNFLPSSRSLDDGDLNHRTVQNTSRSYGGQINHDETETCNELGKANTLVKTIFNERASHDGFVAKTCSKLRQVESEYEDTRYQKQGMSQDISTFFARSFMPESAELVTSTYNEQVIRDESAMKAYNEFKQAGSIFEGIQDEREEVGDYQHITSKIHDDIKDQFEFNCPTGRSNFEANSFENNEYARDVAEWNRSTSFYTEEAVNTSHFERIQNDVTEEALSSQTSEPFGSEDYSRSSCTAKIYLQRETFSNRRRQNGVDTPDKCDREIITKVPTLALNSQDISYSSAGSRECSATQPLDHRALIKALSDVSLKQEKQGENVSRRREGFYHGKDTIDVSCGASHFPAKGEITWRVPRFSTTESPGKTRALSRIPVRISGGRITSPGNKLSECYEPENSGEAANYAESKFIEQSSVPCETIVRQMISQTCERDSLNGLRPRNESAKVPIAKGAFALDNEAAEYEINDHAPGSLTFSNLRSTQSTPFGDYTFDKIHLPDNKFKGQSCPPVFLHKAAYASGRDYAKIDDDVRSRSDRSTSRRSMDVTSATESPGLSKYRKNESSRIESLIPVEEDVTWRTEDECASIVDEENPEDVKDKGYMSCDRKPQESYLQQSEQYELAIESTCEPLPFRTRQHLQPNSSSEIQEGSRKRHAADDLKFNDDKLSFDQNSESTKIAQSENLMYQIHRTQELSNFNARLSSSTLNLDCEPKRKRKKSQERFPFTISEASGILSVKHKDTSDYQSDKNLNHTKMDNQLQEQTIYQLKTHPSVTRLATSGMEDTMADILCCVVQEKEKVTASKSKLKALVRIFFSKLRKAPKQHVDKTMEPAKLIYENSVCQTDSKTNSCSGDSTDEARKMCSNNRLIDHQLAARSKPMLNPSWKTLKKTESLQAIAQEHPHRRYDRDDLWVQEIKDSREKRDSEMTQRKDEIPDSSKDSPPKDRYSIFLAKTSLQSDKALSSNCDNSSKEQHDVLISDHVMPSDGKGKRSIDRKVPSNFISEIEEIEEDPTSCLCWRLCHTIAPFKYRSPVKAGGPVSKVKKSDSLLQKRKK